MKISRFISWDTTSSITLGPRKEKYQECKRWGKRHKNFTVISAWIGALLLLQLTAISIPLKLPTLCFAQCISAQAGFDKWGVWPFIKLMPGTIEVKLLLDPESLFSKWKNREAKHVYESQKRHASYSRMCLPCLLAVFKDCILRMHSQSR